MRMLLRARFAPPADSVMLILCFVMLQLPQLAVGQSDPPLLLRFPSVSKTQIVFNYGGDLWIVSRDGGAAHRLTVHPAEERVVGWTPDGKNILFASWGSSFRHFEDQLYTVPVEGGFPTKLPIPIGDEASFSPDGTHLAYLPHFQWEAAWKRYRGGQTTPIWIADLKDSSVVKVPPENSNDHYPLWI